MKKYRPAQKPYVGLRHLRAQLESANQELATRINELTYSKELLAERERTLSAFISALPNLSFILNEEGRYLEVLANEINLLPAVRENLVGSLIEEVIPAPAATVLMDALQQAIKTDKIQIVEYEIPVMAGGKRWFEGRLTLMEKDASGHSKVVFVAADMTERVRLYEEVVRLANTDALGCFNRRHFMTLAEMALRMAKYSKRPLSFLMMDVDHFKEFNDKHGHPIGDQILSAIVDLCHQQSRGNRKDILGRYGGEEFAILMPDTELAGALKASERLRKKIEALKVNTSGGELSVTVSMGLASVEKDAEEIPLDALIKKADDALYAAKAAGRNCVRTWQDVCAQTKTPAVKNGAEQA